MGWAVHPVLCRLKQDPPVVDIISSSVAHQPSLAIMASGYPGPFEGAEMKEGFLCPLCLKDLQSFYQLQDHYEEEHSGEDRHVKGQLKS